MRCIARPLPSLRVPHCLWSLYSFHYPHSTTIAIGPPILLPFNIGRLSTYPTSPYQTFPWYFHFHLPVSFSTPFPPRFRDRPASIMDANWTNYNIIRTNPHQSPILSSPVFPPSTTPPRSPNYTHRSTPAVTLRSAAVHSTPHKSHAVRLHTHNTSHTPLITMQSHYKGRHLLHRYHHPIPRHPHPEILLISNPHCLVVLITLLPNAHTTLTTPCFTLLSSTWATLSGQNTTTTGRWCATHGRSFHRPCTGCRLQWRHWQRLFQVLHRKRKTKAT